MLNTFIKNLLQINTGRLHYFRNYERRVFFTISVSLCIYAFIIWKVKVSAT